MRELKEIFEKIIKKSREWETSESPEHDACIVDPLDFLGGKPGKVMTNSEY